MIECTHLFYKNYEEIEFMMQQLNALVHESIFIVVVVVIAENERIRIQVCISVCIKSPRHDETDKNDFNPFFSLNI